MIYSSEIKIKNLIIHSVGNKLKGDSVLLSDSTAILNSELEEILMKYFNSAFKTSEFFNFDNIERNEIYKSAKNIFNNSANFASESKNIANFLFEEMRNPKVLGGNLFIVYFENCIVNDILTDAIGIFKAEIADIFLKIKPSNERFGIEREAGINITKLAKSCIICNYEQEKGFLISVIDKKSKNEEISYWSENFLQIVPREDEYFQTTNAIDCIENFVSLGLPEQFEISRADQASLLNKTLNYFNQNENFEWNDFSNELFENQELMEKFDDYRNHFETDNDFEIPDNFQINKPAVKKQAKKLKSTIKLDDNFDIIIHKDKENLLRGKDDATGLNFYQLFFKNED
jgi:hypothetical protein